MAGILAYINSQVSTGFPVETNSIGKLHDCVPVDVCGHILRAFIHLQLK